MTSKDPEGNVFVVCDSCRRAFNNKEDFFDTSASCEWDAESKASDYGFINCRPVNICPDCQDDITSGKIEVNFVRNMTVDEAYDEARRIESGGKNGKAVADRLRQLLDLYRDGRSSEYARMRIKEENGIRVR